MSELPDLASRLLGGGVVYANDEFFAARDNLVEVAPPTFDRQTMGPKGKVYDGWETRRRREPGYDHAIVRLGVPGVVRAVVVDTTFFTGNYPPFASVEGCGVEGYPTPDELAAAEWTPLVPRARLAGDTRNEFAVEVEQRFTHVRLSIYPDGGVARLRVHGEPVPDPRFFPHGPVDLAALENGGVVVGCSDAFYGSPGNLLLPGPARTMGEGWETARRRDAGNDWVELRLGVSGAVALVELDTTHFKGNAPGAATLRGAGGGGDWFDLMPCVRLQPDTRHRFRVDGAPRASHVRLDIFPDGGLARLRLFGAVEPADLAALTVRWFNLLPVTQARHVCIHSGLDEPAADRLVGSRPLTEPGNLVARLVSRASSRAR